MLDHDLPSQTTRPSEASQISMTPTEIIEVAEISEVDITSPNENDELLKSAANNVYEAVIEDEDEFSHEDHTVEAIWLREERARHKSLSWIKRPSVLNICFVVLVFAMSTATGMSAKQVITAKLACNSLAMEGEVCNPVEVQVLLSNLELTFSVLTGIIMFVALGKIGPMSDRYGRKLFLWLNMLAIFLGNLYQYIVMRSYPDLKFAHMVTANLVTSAMGSVGNLMTIMNCYISDVVEPHERIYSLGLGISSLFIGITIGPMLGNFVLDMNTSSIGSELNLNDDSIAPQIVPIPNAEFAPYKLELIIMFSALLYTIFMLPESRSQRARKNSQSLSFSKRRASDAHFDSQTYKFKKMWQFLDSINFLKPLKTLWLTEENVSSSVLPARLIAYRKTVLVLIGMECIFIGLATVLGQVVILYGLYSFKWSQRDVGHLLTISSASKAMVLIVLSPILNHKLFRQILKLELNTTHFDLIDFANCLLGYSVDFMAHLGLYSAASTGQFFTFVVIGSLVSLGIPTVASSIIKYYPESKVGEVYGAISILKNVANLILPVVLVQLYKFGLNTFNHPNFIFLFIAGVYLTFVGCLFYIKLTLNFHEETVEVSEPTFTGALPIGDLHRKHSNLSLERSGRGSVTTS